MAMLVDGQSSFGELAQRFEMTRPAIAKHLETLLAAELVRSHSEGRECINPLDPEALKPVASLLSDDSVLWDNKLDALKRAVEEDSV